MNNGLITLTSYFKRTLVFKDSKIEFNFFNIEKVVILLLVKRINKFIIISGIMMLMLSLMSLSPKAQTNDCGVTPLAQKECELSIWKDVDAYIAKKTEETKRDILTEAFNQHPGLITDWFLNNN